MGAVCCCMHAEDYLNPENPVYRNCTCVRCVFQNFLSLSASVFRHGEVHSTPLPIQISNSVILSTPDNSLADMYHPPPRPLPYDVEPRLDSVSRECLSLRREKGCSHADEETEPLRIDNDADSDSFSTATKWSSSPCEVVKELNPKSSLKLASSKSVGRIGYIYPVEDEDFCPTCLEEYTVENPKIVTKCSHHFHLGCIYEWMERSDSCPVCGKAMSFNESL